VEPVGLCIVGCGRFARFHAHAARQLGGQVALSFASREAGRAEAYRRHFRGVAAFGAYEAAAADPRVHALVVCTPHRLHLEHVRLAIGRRKGALVEKPIAPTLAEADAMLVEAAAAGIPFMVGENVHFAPAFVAVRRALTTGAIGEVRQVLITARTLRRPAGWRLQRREAGGGILLDSGIHYVHLLRDWAGPVASVSAAAPPNRFPDLEGEDTAFVLLRFRSGAVGVLLTSVAAPGLPPGRIWITGTHGTLEVDGRGRFLRLRGVRGRRLRLFVRDRRGLRAQLAAFVANVRGLASPALAPVSTRHDLAVVLAAYRSLETGQVVALGTDEE
jgi:predicted dehydrogenase